MRRFQLLVPLACLALAGCFESEDGLLLDTSHGASPLAEGDYVRDDAKGSVVKLSLQGEGWYTLVDDGETMDLFVSPLGPADSGEYAVAAANDGCAKTPDTCNWDYAILRVDSEQVQEIRPDCQLDWDVAENAASRRSDEVCYFNSPEALMDALAAISAKGRIAETYRQR